MLHYSEIKYCIQRSLQTSAEKICPQVSFQFDHLAASPSWCTESHMALSQYLHVVFRNQGPFASQITQEPFVINGLKTSNNIPNLREKEWEVVWMPVLSLDICIRTNATAKKINQSLYLQRELLITVWFEVIHSPGSAASSSYILLVVRWLLACWRGHVLN